MKCLHVTLNHTHVLFPNLFILFASFVVSSAVEDLEHKVDQNTVLLIAEGQLETKPVTLNGIWEFYPNQLITTREIPLSSNRTLVEVPSWWKEEEGKASIQFGTYRMRVVIPFADRNVPLALKMPDVYCSYALFVNGKKLGQNGTVGSSKNESRPQWKPETYFVEQANDTLEIVIQLSNFYHHRTGINSPLLLGSADQLSSSKNRTEVSNAFLLVGLACLGFMSIVFYHKSRSISFVLYSLLCLSWIIRAAFSNHYQIVQWFQDINWYLVVRTEYISLYLSTLFGSLLVGSLFPREVSKVFRAIYIVASIGFTLFTLLVSPLLFTAYVQLYLGLSSALLLSILVIVTRAYSVSREGATLVLIAAFFGVAMFGYVIMAYQGVFPMSELFFNTGFLLQFILTLIAIDKRVRKNDTGHDYDMMTFEGATRK